MKQNKNIFPSLSIAAALLIATMFASCTKAELEAPVLKQSAEIRFGIEKNIISKTLTKSGSESESRVLLDYDSNDPSSVGLSMTVVDGIETPISKLPATKGTQISQKEQVTSFDVISYLYADESATNGALFLEDTVIDGVNTTNNTYYWPPFGVMDFIAAYPSDLFDENEMQTKVKENGQIQFNYTIPSAVEEQQDIMIAMTNDVDCTVGAPVPLQFKHLLAAVQFKVGDMMLIKINSLSINGVKGGDVTIQYGENGWSYNSSTTTKYDVIYSTNNEPNFDTSGLPTGSYIAGNDNGLTMFVMPQELGGAQSITINYTELATGEPESKTIKFEGNLAHSWQAGKTTTYVLNIGTTVDIEIPTPPDADAHYVIVDMSYKISELAQKGFYDFEATAYWEDDANNNSSKSNISLKTSLTEMQANGYFTDELWVLEYEVVEGGYKIDGNVVTTLPAPRYKEDILGSPLIKLNENEGKIYLFLDENNGTKARTGVLKLTAKIKGNNGESKTIVIGNGRFKQLCPYWTSNIGLERIEDVKDGKDETFPYGFAYDRVVTFSAPSYLTEEWFIADGLRRLLLFFMGSTAEEVLPDTSIDIAKEFVDITQEEIAGKQVIKKIVLNYNKLSALSEVANSEDGKVNTEKLYNYTGNIDISTIEATLYKNLVTDQSTLRKWTRTITGESTDVPKLYAAYIALKRNKLREVHTIVSQSGETPTTIYEAILHKVDERSANPGKDIIEWYLPSAYEAQFLEEDLNGSSYISPLEGTYWSSTAGDDASGQAYTYICSNNKYERVNPNEGRLNNAKVRAVRKKPTAN